MKKILCILLCMVWVLGIGCLSVAADTPAGDTESSAEVAGPVPAPETDELMDIQWPDGGEITPIDLLGMANASSGVFLLIQEFLKDGSSGFLFINGTHIVSMLYPVCMTLGILIMLILWAINVGSKAMKLELYDGKTLLQSSLPLIGGIIFMPVSYALLRLIDTLCSALTQTFIGSTNIQLFQQAIMYSAGYEDFRSDVPIVGGLIQLISWLCASSPLLLMNLLFLVLSVFIAVTIGIRVVKLAIYQGTAPAFIALGVNDETKQYQKNFFAMYIQTAIQLPVIAILLGAFQIAYSGYINSQIAGAGTFTWQMTAYGGILMLVLAIMVVKSDKLFSRVFMQI